MKTELQHAYQTLGVPFGAPRQDVRTAYRNLIRANHPDHVHADASAANRRLAEVIAAKHLIDRTPFDVVEDNPATIRARREAEARAFRKAMEARALAAAQAEEVVPARSSYVARDWNEVREQERTCHNRQSTLSKAMTEQL